MPQTKPKITIIGGGSAALMLACHLDENKFDIAIYERNNALGRKFLVAGDGGLNLTYAEELNSFVGRYSPPHFLEAAIRAFDNTQLRNWLHQQGIETFIGSSNRVFPLKGIKPIDVLNVFLKRIKQKGIPVHTNYLWKGWNSQQELLFEHQGKEVVIPSDKIIFALGGKSWNKTGSDGSWNEAFLKHSISLLPFQASNCAVEINWDEKILVKAEGKSLKNISITSGNTTKLGEVVITKYGMEGGAIYALSPQIREQLNTRNKATITIDLKPALTIQQILSTLNNNSGLTISAILKEKLNLSDAQFALLKFNLTKEEFLNKEILAKSIKNLVLEITGTAPIDQAISTVGGVALDEVDDSFQLKKIPGNYVIGEMLDWDAPTGGYLLQASFSMGYYLGQKLNSQM
ncbi:TIGR03862 family flavoprotein [soil metagenome]